ncbi:MAG TPA: hypothetical protein VMU38_08970 [Candidatus Binatia bacterium]|nr:hypothetical protein [Candidatus Binatia bacterium]
MTNVLAMLLALAQPATHLAIEPWTGSDLQTTSAGAAKYRLTISGKPNASIRLQANHVAQGWLAAFCTQRLCSPHRVEVALPATGAAVLQFELIRESGSAPKESSATITADGTTSIAVPAAYRQ